MENRFAAARRRYLRTHMDGIYTGMLLTGTLEPHLAEIGESAQAMFDRLVGADEKGRRRHRAVEGRRSDGMGRADEQYPQPRRRRSSFLSWSTAEVRPCSGE